MTLPTGLARAGRLGVSQPMAGQRWQGFKFLLFPLSINAPGLGRRDGTSGSGRGARLVLPPASSWALKSFPQESSRSPSTQRSKGSIVESATFFALGALGVLRTLRALRTPVRQYHTKSSDAHLCA